MKTYETIFFLSPSLSEESNEALSGKVEGAITRFGGQIEKVNRWGKRRLSYKVDRHSEGFYIHIEFKGSNEVLKELERFYLINQEILRFMTTAKAQ